MPEMRSYTSLIDEELEGDTPKQKYDNLMKMQADLIHYKSKLDYAIMNLKAIADTESIDKGIRNLCGIVHDIASKKPD